MHSFGESSTQPSTPCSHSGECGGNRSTDGPRCDTAFCRRAFFKSGAAPAVSETESIIDSHLSKMLLSAVQNGKASSNVYLASPHENIFPPTLVFLGF